MNQARLSLSMSICLALVAVLGLGGCGSLLMSGGTLVDKNYQVKDVVVKYRAEGKTFEHTQYFLIKTEQGLAIFERSEDGSGTLMEAVWSTESEDQFSCWIGRRTAWVVVVPKDRSKPAKRYVYSYAGRGSPFGIDGNHVIPDSPAQPVPVTTLTPIE